MAAKNPASKRLSVSIIGPGNLGTALAVTLADAGYEVRSIAIRKGSRGRQRATALAGKLKTRLVEAGRDPFDSDLVWIAVSDDAIADVARQLAPIGSWKNRTVFHSSGALSSDELVALRRRGAAVASVHPMMTFVRASVPEMAGVAFALEGDASAVRMAKSVVSRLGGNGFPIAKSKKALYHAFGSFASPLVVALMSSLEQVAKSAGIRGRDIKPIMTPLLWQTLNNYLKNDAAAAFSGPLARGDVATVRKHLNALEQLPEARAVYVALAGAAVRYLPAKKGRVLKKELDKVRK